jgi:hypothetical protein
MEGNNRKARQAKSRNEKSPEKLITKWYLSSQNQNI